jgi:hypothetical protein
MTIIAYLPTKEKLEKYWDDADDVEFTEEDEITFSSRFPKPDYFKPSTPQADTEKEVK